MFGPTGPPGTYTGGAAALAAGAAQFYSDEVDLLRKSPEPGSYGFNMHIINESTTAMLDIPMRSSISTLQSKIEPGQTIT